MSQPTKYLVCDVDTVSVNVIVTVPDEKVAPVPSSKSVASKVPATSPSSRYTWIVIYASVAVDPMLLSIISSVQSEG